MAENLNYAMPGSVCLDNEVSNCAKYGQLYNLDKLYKDEKKKRKMEKWTFVLRGGAFQVKPILIH